MYLKVGNAFLQRASFPISLVANEIYHLVYKFDNGGTNYLTVNTVSLATSGTPDETGGDISIAAGVKLMSHLTDFTSGKIYLARQFNRMLTAAEVIEHYNNGRPDLYRLPYADIGASQAALTSGTLVVGKRYIIDTYNASDDFTNVGAASNASGVTFIATGTTPTTWTASSSLRATGCNAEYLPENMGRLGAIETMGGLHGSSAGSPISLSAEQKATIYRDVKLSIANSATTLTNIVPNGYMIESIRAKASDSITAVKIGTSSGGEQVVASVAAGTTPTILTLAATAQAGYSESASDTLFAEHATAGQTLDLIFTFRRSG